MKISNLNKINGYIEGYYGKLLHWSDRYKIIEKLYSNKMNFYFYCPKEDIYNRFNWKKNYPKEWWFQFNNFCKFAEKKGIKIITGLSPGLDFNFTTDLKKNKDIKILLKKFRNFLKFGASYIALQFDDIPDDFNIKYNLLDEGKVHAEISNYLNHKIKKKIFVVPRVYSDEISTRDNKYLKSFFETLFCEINVFYCGEYIVSKNFRTKINIIKKQLKNKKIIFWDNLYANDYCPRRLFIGPWMNKNNTSRTMINGTGMLMTDLLILDIFYYCKKSQNKKKSWIFCLKKNRVHSDFSYISKFFLYPNFNDKDKLFDFKTNNKVYNAIENLLWNWKSTLSMEWYPYILSLKQDLQIFEKKIDRIRILKTQTHPLQRQILQE